MAYILTNHRIGLIGKKVLFFNKLSCIYNVMLVENDTLFIDYGSRGVYGVHAFSDVTAEQFLALLLTQREQILFEPAAAAVRKAVKAACKDRFNDTFEHLSLAFNLEHFHAGPLLMLAQLHRYFGRGNAAAGSLIYACSRLDIDAYHIISTLLEAPLSAAQLYYLARTFSSAMLADERPFLTTAINALAARRQGQNDKAAMLIDQTVARAELENIGSAFIYAFYGMNVVPAKNRKNLINRIRSHTYEIIDSFLAVNERELFCKKADKLTDPQDALRAELEWYKYNDNDTHTLPPRGAHRQLEQWSEVLELGAEPPSNHERLDEAPDDYFCSTALYHFWTWLLDPKDAIESTWVVLRLHDNEAVEEILGDTNIEDFVKDVREGTPQGSAVAWLAGLAGAELHLRKGNLGAAQAILDDAYASVATSVGDIDDSYTQYASALYGLYKALISQDSKAIAYHQDLFHNRPGFLWVNSLVATLNAPVIPDRKTYGESPSIDEFGAWVDSAKQALELEKNQENQEAAEAFNTAQARYATNSGGRGKVASSAAELAHKLALLSFNQANMEVEQIGREIGKLRNIAMDDPATFALLINMLTKDIRRGASLYVIKEVIKRIDLARDYFLQWVIDSTKGFTGDREILKRFVQTDLLVGLNKYIAVMDDARVLAWRTIAEHMGDEVDPLFNALRIQGRLKAGSVLERIAEVTSNVSLTAELEDLNGIIADLLADSFFMETDSTQPKTNQLESTPPNLYDLIELFNLISCGADDRILPDSKQLDRFYIALLKRFAEIDKNVRYIMASDTDEEEHGISRMQECILDYFERERMTILEEAHQKIADLEVERATAMEASRSKREISKQAAQWAARFRQHSAAN